MFGVVGAAKAGAHGEIVFPAVPVGLSDDFLAQHLLGVADMAELENDRLMAEHLLDVAMDLYERRV